MAFVLLFYLLLQLVSSQDPGTDNSWFLLRHSFKPPYFQAGTQRIAFWNPTGVAVVGDQFVQLTPNERGKSGAIWNMKPIKDPDWEVHLKIVIGKPTGTDSVLGADGLAFWVTKEPGAIGPVFGNVDRWEGLAIMFDTWDNDENGDNPAVYAIFNNGQQSFNHNNDGLEQRLGACNLHYRTLSYDQQHLRPAHFKIRYEQGGLHVSYDMNSLGNEATENWQTCFSVLVSLPSPAFFGVSAATGDITDYHDVVSVATYGATKPPPVNIEEGIRNWQRLKGAAFKEQLKHINFWGQKIASLTVEEPKEEAEHDEYNPEIPVRLIFPDERASEAGEYLYKLQLKQMEFTDDVHEQFDKFNDRLDILQEHTASIISELTSSIGALDDALKKGKNAATEFESDLSILDSDFEVLKNKLLTLTNSIHETRKTTEELRDHNKQRNELLSSIFTSHSTGFWFFFAVFETFFCFVVFVYVKKDKEWNRKRM